MWSDFLVIIVSIMIFVASEFFLPGARRQRHFYSILLTAFSLVIGFVLKTSFETQRKITAVEKVFTSVADSPMKQHFSDIFTSYHKHFRQPIYSPLLEPWINSAIKSLSIEMNQISISLPPSAAKTKLFDLYTLADDHILAMHVGSLDEYFNDQRYIDANLKASNRGIPVVRFYLFEGMYERTADKERRNILGHDYIRRDGVTLSEYNKKVKEVHTEMKTLLSVVVIRSPDKLDASTRRDFLMVDGHFLAERMSDAGIMRATGESGALSKARMLLQELMAKDAKDAKSEYIHRLANNEVCDRFGRYSRIDCSGNRQSSLAEALARHLLQ